MCKSVQNDRFPHVMVFNVHLVLLYKQCMCYINVTGCRIGISSSNTNSYASSISHIIIVMGISANLAMFWRTMHSSSSPVSGTASSIAQVVIYGVVQLVGVGNSSRSQHSQSVTYGLMWWCITVYRWMYMKNKLNIYSVYTTEIQKWIHNCSVW